MGQQLRLLNFSVFLTIIQMKFLPASDGNILGQMQIITDRTTPQSCGNIQTGTTTTSTTSSQETTSGQYMLYNHLCFHALLISFIPYNQ